MLTVNDFPEDRQVYFKNPNKQDLYRMPYHGLYHNAMKEFPEREYLVYIPECAYLSTPAVLLIPDEQDSKLGFVENSGWAQAADENGMLLFVTDPDVTEEECCKMIDEMRLRECFTANKNYLYLAGYGTGAARAQRLAMKNPSAFGGLVLAGACDVPEKELKAMDEVPSEVPFCPLSQVSMPVWLLTEKLTENQQAVLEYWKKANKVQPESYVSQGSTWYLPSEYTEHSLIEELVGGKVRVNEGVSFDSYPSVSPDKIWKEQFSRYFRSTGIGNFNLKVWRTEEEAGVEFKTIEVDGYRREWYQYIPSKMRQNPDYKAPLVVSCHGGSNLHKMFLPATDWIKVAEARGLMVVFPAAALRHFPKTNWLPHAAWNASANDEQLNDEKFIREMVNYLTEHYSIDKGRIYATGHSMGSAMGQRLLLAMPDIFAAAGLTSGVLRGGFFGNYETPGIVEDHQRPIWILMGEKDIGGGTPENNPDVAKYIEYWTKRDKTAAPEHPKTYQTGAYATRVYCNKDGVPMVNFSTVENKPHSCTAQDSWFLYDEFFSKFHLDEQGRSVYMNSDAAE